MLAILSALCFGLGILLGLLGPAVSVRSIASDCNLGGNPAAAAACLERYGPGVLLMPIFVIGIVGVLVLAGAAAQRWTRSLIRLPLALLQEIDPRPPILFLRAFADDQVPLRPPRIAALARMLEFGVRRTSLDHMLLEEGTPYGPVVALGNPEDKRPPYGAARGYFTNNTWQQAVEKLSRDSIAVVICIDDTDGVWWEAAHLAASGHLGKTLFLLHPRFASPGVNAALLSHLAAVLRLTPAQTQALLRPGPTRRWRKPLTVIGFVARYDGSLSVLNSSWFSRFSYQLASRLFLRVELGLSPVPVSETAFSGTTRAMPERL